jgi:hypothetical protein
MGKDMIEGLLSEKDSTSCAGKRSKGRKGEKNFQRREGAEVGEKAS